MLTASVSYLAHSSLLPDKLREQAESLYTPALRGQLQVLRHLITVEAAD